MGTALVYKYFCLPFSHEDDALLREQLRFGAEYRRGLAQIENCFRTLSRAIGDWPIFPVPLDQRKGWWKTADGIAARKAWEASDEHKRLTDQIHDARRFANRALRFRVRNLVWYMCNYKWIPANGAPKWYMRDYEWRLINPLYVGTTELSESAAEQASRLPLFDKEGDTTFMNTRFPSDEGAVGIQFIVDKQKPASSVSPPSLIGGCHTSVRISDVKYALAPRTTHLDTHTNIHRHYQTPALDPTTGAALDVFKNGDLKRKRLQTLSVRVGTIRGTQKPIWARMHILLHRDLPEGTMRRFYLKRERIGTRFRWQAYFTIDPTTAKSYVPLVHAAPHTGLAIDIGWRKMHDERGGYRVFYWMGSDGQEGDFRVPEELVERRQFSDHLRSRRDLAKNTARDMLLVYIQTLPSTSWLRQEASHMAQWKRTGKFVQLYRRWTQQRIHGDQAAYAALGAWLKQDEHLWDWEAFNRAKAARQVMGRVEAEVAQLTRRYGVVTVEDFNLQALIAEAQILKTDPEAERQRKLNAQRVLALAPGRARAAFKMFVAKYGGVPVVASAAFTTIDCASCGARRQIADRAQLVLTCDACGYAEDQDRTACRNLLGAMMSLASGGDGWPLTARVPPPTKKKLGARSRRKKPPEVGTGSTYPDGGETGAGDNP